ncbi:C40 family peptidase [Paenibacillus swuensis]|uniref:C40 family peptidase n=1 Tax=Paenibacillus swuensis TaxID=1178515 RepID=UPI0018D47B74|nr:NlpC/P60 family protein [Paenibacillus swuensis]
MASAIALPVVSQAAVNVQVNDNLVKFNSDAKPFLYGSRVQIPLRTVSENLGFDVQWKESGQVLLSNGEKNIVLGSAETATSAKGKTFVPLRFVSEELGIDVDWFGKVNLAVVNADGTTNPPVLHPVKAAYDNSGLSDKILKSARSYLGVPYKWGGTTTAGFDCSGFINYIFEKNGVSLPRTSSQMFKSSGERTAHPEPGDLVFFGKSGVDHVGVYIGNNQFISASNNGVDVDSMGSSYWGSRYIGAKSVI